MPAHQYEYHEDQTIAMPPNMPPKLLIRFCKLQKAFWNTFLHEVEEYYRKENGPFSGEEAEEKESGSNSEDECKTPVKEHGIEVTIPDAPRKSLSRPPSGVGEGVVARKLEYPDPVAEAAVEPVAEAVVEPVAEAAVEPVAEAVVEPVAEAAVVKKAAKKTAKPKKTKTVEEPVVEVNPDLPADEPVAEAAVVKKTAKKTAKPKKTKTVEEPVAEEEAAEQIEKPVVEKKRRGPSEYNLFISSEVERLRKEDPGLNHKVAFKMAVAAWKERGNPTPTNTNETEPTSEPEVDPQNVTLEEAC